jgi:hypothetical protein
VVPAHENTPVILLYPIGPVAERDVRFILLLNVIQSATESAPVVEIDARARESCWPERESPFADQRVTAA